MVNLFFYTYLTFNWILQLSVLASFLIFLILLTKNLFKNKLGVKFHYMIWFIIILRLSIPQLPTSSFSMFNFIPKINKMPPLIVVQKNTPNKAQATIPVKLNNVYNTDNSLNSLTSLDTNYVAMNMPITWSITLLFPFIWAVGVLLISIYRMGIYFHFRRKILKLPPVTDNEILNILENCQNKMGINKSINLVITKQIKSPSILGFVNPILMIPENLIKTLPINKFSHIFLHELAHLKRKDILTNWIILILRTLHWFNPVVQYGLNRMCEDMEISCDSLALSYLDSEDPKEYGLTIINVMESFSKSFRLPGMASIVNNKSNIKRRIIMIKLFNKKSYKFSAIAIAALLALGCTALTDAKASSLKNQFTGSKFKHTDKIDYSFVNDPQIVGKWQSVDFVKEISDFKVNEKSWKDDLYVKELNFLQDGKVSKTVFSWTKDIIINPVDKTASKYVIKDISGSTYMFFEWKSGDYTFRGMKPSYYVMKKVNSTPSLTTNMFGKEVGARRVDKIDYPFVDDAKVIGKWESVDFVKTPADFKPDVQSWKDDLFLKDLTFSKDGKLNNKNLTWTNGIVIDKLDKTASKYTIKEINGSSYMFFEWKNGDYINAGMDPYYYVLKKVN